MIIWIPFYDVRMQRRRSLWLKIWLRAFLLQIIFFIIILPSEMNMENAFVQSLQIDKITTTKFSSDVDHYQHQYQHQYQQSKGFDNSNMTIECPSSAQNSVCPCYKFDDGLHLECPGATAMSLKTTLQMITSPIQSLSIFEFDRSVTSLSQDVFQPGVNIRHIQFTHSHLEMLKDNSLKNTRGYLESLSIVNGKLTQVPKMALNGMTKLMILDFNSNDINEIDDFSFHGLRLTKLNMKGNKLENLPENAFNGLEETIQDIDLSENQLKIFPISAVKSLDHLRTLRLSFNKIQQIYNLDRNINSVRLHSLTTLDLSSNQFNKILDDNFRLFSQLTTLSLYSNQIEIVHTTSFRSIKELISLDMSRNRIIYLDSKIFETNKRLQTIDLSHNHIHSINGVFSNLPKLHEIFLSENNILELPNNAFTNSIKIDVIYLEANAIRYIDPMVFNTLYNLQQLYLRSNFIQQLPVTMLDKTLNLTSLSLDDNEIKDLEIGMFRKLEYLREVRLHNNKIRRIAKGVFAPLPRLQELHLQQNNIDEIEINAFATLINLQHINLQNNQLTFIDDIFPNNQKHSKIDNHNYYNNNNKNVNLNKNKTTLTTSSAISKTSHLLSIQLNSNLITNIYENSFKNQENIKIMWLNENRLTIIDKNLFKDSKNLDKLYLSNNLIQTILIDSFKFIQNLRLLDLSINQLKLIRRDYFLHLNDIEEINLSYNLIETIEKLSFNLLKKLKILNLSNNPLIQIKENLFQNDLYNIQNLYINNCSLRKIEVNSFNSLINLNELNFNDNLLSYGDINKLYIPSLRILKLSNNNFSHIGINIIGNIFDKLRSLQELTLFNCSLNEIPEEIFIKNTNLVKINLCNNNLKNLKRNLFNGLNVFKELRLCNNQLNDFPHISLYNITTLEILILSNNNLINIDFFKLSGILNIRLLDFKYNKIATLSGFNSVNLTQLDYIDLSENRLLSLPNNFLQYSINLQRVDLSNNRFLQIPSTLLSDISSLTRLSWLNLTSNPINKIFTIREERYPFLKELYICNTNLTILTSKDFDAFDNLQHLHLIKNRIMRISPGAFNTLSNLLTLDISINELELIPKERLQGLKLLRLLNLSHNSLKDLEEFSSDLIKLQIFDLSFNQLNRISKNTFRNLIGLTELNLMGNRMTIISSDGFKNLQKLRELDLRKNYFEIMPLDAFKPLETNLRTLKIEENPLQCSCDSQKLWEWLRDHQKWTIDDNINYLRCEQPGELRGKIFIKLEPQQFCDAPLIVKLAIQDIQPYSVVVSWQSREHSGLNGYEIVYHALEGVDEVRSKTLSGFANSAKLQKLTSSTRYLICVLGTGNWLTPQTQTALTRLRFNESFIVGEDLNNMIMNILPDGLQDILQDSPTSRCTEVRTLDATPSLITDENGLSSQGLFHSILTRRLGLIVGCCMGIIVFIVLISILSYIKLKKQRIENSKRQQPLPPEYISYRHFSIPNSDDPANRNTIISSSVVNNNCIPGGISAHINSTTINNSSSTKTTTTILDINNTPILSNDKNHTHSSYMSSGVVLGANNLSAC